MASAEIDRSDRLPPRCWRCGRTFDRSFKRASEGANQEVFNNPHDLCLWCHIQFSRDEEVRCDPLNDSERETARHLQACIAAREAGWRIESDRVAPRRRSFVAKVIDPAGVIVHEVGRGSPTGSDYAAMLARRFMSKAFLAAQARH